MRGGAVLRREEVTAPAWAYLAHHRDDDGPGAYVEVAQMSDRFGPGAWARIGPVD